MAKKDIKKSEAWSKIIKKRRLKWLGHLTRLDENTPARKSLAEALKPGRRDRGRPVTRWLDIIQKDLGEVDADLLVKNNNFLLKLQEITYDRKRWNDIIHKLCD